MEFAVVRLVRSLELSQTYTPQRVGAVTVGLQAINGDLATIEIQGADAVDQLEIPVGTAATAQGYTFINRGVAVDLPEEERRQRRFLFFGRGDDNDQNGVMECEMDIRWGDQALDVPEPEEDVAYDFILVKQFGTVADRPLVYKNQDRMRFGEITLSIGEKVEPDSRNYRRQRYAPLLIEEPSEDEPEEWQVRLNEKYQRKGKYRVKITHFDWTSDWYQSYGFSIVYGRPKAESDETEEQFADGIVEAGYSASHYGDSTSRLEEARHNPNQEILREGDAKNIGALGLKVMSIQPGAVKVMILEPRVKVLTLQPGEVYDVAKWDVSLIGVYGDQAIVQVIEDN